jgi:small multidrug resistance family-3 protein
MTGRSIGLFIAAAIAEIGGAFLVWKGIKEGRGLAAYGGVFILGSLLWAAAFDGSRPRATDVIGAVVAIVGAAIIMYGH